MKTIGFIGAFDKIDLITNIAKALVDLERKVLVIDTTKLQKAKYIVPSISPTKSYITSFENVDFALGFEDFDGIIKYLGLNDQDEKERKLPYDYILIDIDEGESFKKFKMQEAENNYFVTGFDLYSLKKGMNIVQDIETPVKLTKVLFSYEIVKEDEDYLDFISLEYKVIWNEYAIYFTITTEDNKAIEENQRVQQIRLKRLSNDYKDSLAFIVQDIIKDININKVKKIIKG